MCAPPGETAGMRQDILRICNLPYVGTAAYRSETNTCSRLESYPATVYHFGNFTIQSQ